MFDSTNINKKIEDLILATDKDSKEAINSLDLISQLVNLSNKDYNLIEGENFYYIKRGENPRAVLHLNITNFLKKFSYGLSQKEDGKYVFTDGDSSLLNPILIFKVLSDRSDIDFDILITKKNIYDKKNNFSDLENILRSGNIINFNLRQSNCIADTFASSTIVNITIPIKRNDFNKDDYAFYSIGIKDLVGGNSALDIDKVRLNAIKSLLGVIRKIKSKVDIDILSFDGGNRYDNIPSSAKCELCVHKDYKNDLLKVFEIEKNSYLEKVLKLEPNVNLYIEECEDSNKLPMTSDSFSHLASFIELSINGAYEVDTSTGQLISSSIISNAKTHDDHLSLLLVFRSLNDKGLKEMIEKTKLAASVSNANLLTRYYIPPWQNKDDTLTDIFKEAYKDITDEDLSIVKTQYSIEGNLIFNSFPVKMISLGVKYKQEDNNLFFTNLDDISILICLIKRVLLKLEEVGVTHE